MARLHNQNLKIKLRQKKDGRDSTNQSMVESTTETLPSADITEPTTFEYIKR